MRFVQQPEPGSAHDHGRERHPTSLTGGQPPDVDPGKTGLHTDGDEGGIGVLDGHPDGLGEESDVVDDGQIVVEERRLRHEAHERTDRDPIGDEVDAEDDGPIGRNGGQTSTEPGATSSFPLRSGR